MVRNPIDVDASLEAILRGGQGPRRNVPQRVRWRVPWVRQHGVARRFAVRL